MQLVDSLAVGLRPVVQGVAAVPVLFRRASQVDEDPDRGVPWLDARIVAVSQHIHPGERALGEERQQALAQRVRYRVVHGSNLTAGSDKRASTLRPVNLWIDFMKSTRRLMAARPYGESRGSHHAYVRDKDLDFPNGLVVAAKGTSSPSEREAKSQ